MGRRKGRREEGEGEGRTHERCNDFICVAQFISMPLVLLCISALPRPNTRSNTYEMAYSASTPPAGARAAEGAHRWRRRKGQSWMRGRKQG